MFESLQMAPPDAILGLTELFRKDPNPDKINVAMGVYCDESGSTPILECVKQAEIRLLAEETSKSYLGMAGLDGFGGLVQTLVFGEKPAGERAVTLQTPGGTGALRVAADFLRQKAGAERIWVSSPTWANHPNIFKAAGLEVDSYAYLQADSLLLDFTALCDALAGIPAGDVVCLHACCHNPTGVDLSAEQWGQVADICAQNKLLPLLDFAYQGFGDGLVEDAMAIRYFMEQGSEMLICSSFSKNFGLYCERVGALTIVAGSADAAQAALSHAKLSVRTNYSNPPKHGGAIVATILGDDELATRWQQEVDAMRQRIHEMRGAFASGMKERTDVRDFSFIEDQRGMFSYSGLTREQVDRLREEHSIYAVGSGRINVAGMTPGNLDRLCDAIAAVL
jgi:aspartate/tyrosine/aromatic aminotransferase